ncbi:conserved hypothetical protein [Talaromyces stipitatus ATCC 10500]|uniref:non-specific serine/threonine protein kinase n=1 Tax=Talaromyces stipitatus (strain ATCC 10500 / CBS 375.48 / QM 6759 / NRRL 1006) TaxID=441959 RepID=B8MKU0_TALSN|nr:uncharacterized protein TSTA_044060 [Talaromyces stipitatus ATCC 10500]EED14939.1 conserved hypothetical protein [Talaromyces stipitatus ATCC 10500]
MRTVRQRRVYGKRKTNAPRAVLENGSPIKSTSSESLSLDQMVKQEISEDIVKEIGIQVANITLDDDPPTKVDANDSQTLEESPAEKKYQTSVGTPASSKRANDTHEPLPTPSNYAQSQSPLKVYSSQKRLSFTPRQPRAKPVRKTKPIARFSSGCVENEKANDYVRKILDEATSQLPGRGVQKFSSWANRSESAFDPVKIAEGSYGEVYKLRLKENIFKRNMSKSRLAKLREYGEGVFKVVPLRAQKGLGSKKFTTIDEIVAEVKLLKLLDPIPGFARFREVHVVQGRFPPSFQKAWDAYKAAGEDCENPNPANKRAYSDQQLWAILEMDDAGVELEKFNWSSVFQIYDIFWGVAMGLARAEEYALFEHRDLHLGNVCLRSTRPDGDMQLLAPVDATQLANSSGFGVSSLETTIIDYSLSRAELRLTDDLEGKIDIASTDLDSKGLFDAVGRDEAEIFQRNTYRYMRAQLYTGVPLAEENPPNIPGIWAEYAPKTNLIWLLFILKMLVKHMKHKDYTLREDLLENQTRKPLQSCPDRANIQQQDHSIKQPKTRTPESAINTFDNDNLGKALTKLQITLTKRLNMVLEILDLEHGRDDMCCAADLVAYAIDQHWLDETDFFLD